MFQWPGVNVRLAGETVPSLVSLEDSPIGHVGRRLAGEHDLNVAVPPASVVIKPEVGRNHNPRRVVVRVDDRHVGGVQAVVSRVGAGGRGGDDRVRDVAVDHVVVHAVTVTVCGPFQSPGVKVRLTGETVPSPVSLEESPMVTSAVGWLLSTTVNVAVPPASVVVRPEVGVTVIPAVSSSCWPPPRRRRCGRCNRVRAGGRGRDDRVAHVAVVHVVVHAGDGHGLGHVPIRRP